jgi:hypothetical protein
VCFTNRRTCGKNTIGHSTEFLSSAVVCTEMYEIVYDDIYLNYGTYEYMSLKVK